VPTSARGRRTRERLLEAARAVFERDGYVSARVTDIADGADVAHGTFYTYFTSKEDVFHELALQAVEQLDRAAIGEPDLDLPPTQAVRHVARRFLTAYRREAPIIALLEQVATFSDGLGEVRNQLRERVIARGTRVIESYQQRGLADPELDALCAATALGSMVDNFAYVWIVLGAEFDEDVVVETIGRIWAGGIGLRDSG
jgi:AcrR family transcriptional regulator